MPGGGQKTLTPRQPNIFGSGEEAVISRPPQTVNDATAVFFKGVPWLTELSRIKIFVFILFFGIRSRRCGSFLDRGGLGFG